MVVCNHVLEHVPDDWKALSEILRVLEPGGVAILQTPFSSVLTRALEDPGIKTAADREVFYGQDDHVRMYGLDVFERIREAGFALELHPHRASFPEGSEVKMGVNPAEDLILARKPMGKPTT